MMANAQQQHKTPRCQQVSFLNVHIMTSQSIMWTLHLFYGAVPCIILCSSAVNSDKWVSAIGQLPQNRSFIYFAGILNGKSLTT